MIPTMIATPSRSPSSFFMWTDWLEPLRFSPDSETDWPIKLDRFYNKNKHWPIWPILETEKSLCKPINQPTNQPKLNENTCLRYDQIS